MVLIAEGQKDKLLILPNQIPRHYVSHGSHLVLFICPYPNYTRRMDWLEYGATHLFLDMGRITISIIHLSMLMCYLFFFLFY